MGGRGRAYVMENYQWSQVLDRIEQTHEVRQAGSGAPSRT